MLSFDPVEFYNRLYATGLTLLAGIGIAEWARWRGLWGQKKWDIQKARFDLLKTVQLGRIEALEAVLAKVSKLDGMLSGVTVSSVLIRKREKAGQTVAASERRSLTGAKRNMFNAFMDVSQAAQTYGKLPGSIGEHDLNELWLLLAKDLADGLEGLESGRDGESWPMQGLEASDEFKSLVVSLLEEERKILEAGPTEDSRIFRGPARREPHLLYLRKVPNNLRGPEDAAEDVLRMYEACGMRET